MQPGTGPGDDAASSSNPRLLPQLNPESPRMRTPTSLHAPRPVATAPSSDTYRIQAGRLVTFAGHVRASALVAGSADPAPEAARKAA